MKCLGKILVYGGLCLSGSRWSGYLGTFKESFLSMYHCGRGSIHLPVTVPCLPAVLRPSPAGRKIRGDDFLALPPTHLPTLLLNRQG